MGEPQPGPAIAIPRTPRGSAGQRPETVLAGLQASAGRFAGRPAIIDGKTVISYAELVASVERLAAAIRIYGVPPGGRIGVVAERSWTAVISLLATLRAQASYVPLDPAFPHDRLRYMVRDAGLRKVIGRQRTCGPAANFPQDLAAEYICIDAAVRRGANRAGLPGPAPRPDSLAYILYTSGSTGRPKGIAVPHRALATAADSLVSLFELGPGDRMLSFASLGWDTAGEEIYPTLLAGATLVIDPRAVNGSIPSFLSTIAEHDVTVVDVPTGFWNGLVDFLELTSEQLPPSLRLVIIGGEEVHAPQVRAWSRLAREDVRLVNTYGQTETVLITHAAEIGGSFGASLADDDLVPIGTPLPHIQEALAGNGPGPARELLIGGPALAWGYHGNPGQTADRFVPCPGTDDSWTNAVASAPGTRVYHTGDLVRRRDDLTLAYVGRTDRQVQIRGHRVEPEETERALLACPGVTAAVVLPIERPSGLSLAAIFVPSAGTTPGPAELAKQLSARLPSFALPDRIIPVLEIPTQANGKVNYPVVRKILEDDELGAPDSGPHTVTDRLAALASQVLGRPCGVDDDFFDRGGDSLLATKLISRIYRRFDVELTFLDVFEQRTPRNLAETVLARRVMAAAEAAAPAAATTAVSW